ncbi:hypothetical protein OSTOST_10199, partial [Ostertagia ostertagi]
MWKNLKDTYRRKNNPTTGSASGPQWTYLQAMRFLERNQHDGPTLSNVDEEGNYRMSLELESSSVASQNDTPPLQSSAPKRGRRDSDGGSFTTE